MLTPAIINKSCDELHEALADIFDSELSKVEKHDAVENALMDWRAYVDGMQAGYEVSKSETLKATPALQVVPIQKETKPKMTAQAELNAKAEVIRKAEPGLTKEQAWTRAYLDPANTGVSQRFRDEERAAKAMQSRSDQVRTSPSPALPGNEATHPHLHTAFESDDPRNDLTHPHGYTHGDGGAGGTLDSHPQGPSGIDRLYSKYKASVPGMDKTAFQAMVRDIGRTYGLSSSDIDGDQPLHKKQSMADRVTALAGSLSHRHPGLSHDDAVARVLERNKPLADAYAREKGGK
jgi:hypothetical protein